MARVIPGSLADKADIARGLRVDDLRTALLEVQDRYAYLTLVIWPPIRARRKIGSKGSIWNCKRAEVSRLVVLPVSFDGLFRCSSRLTNARATIPGMHLGNHQDRASVAGPG